MSRFDVAIVGAGPAGAWAARALALSGARVAVFDASHPREKPCGGGLTGRALALLDCAGITNQVPGVAARTLRFCSGSLSEPGQTVMPLGDGHSPPLVIVSRLALDQALLGAATAAGATWLAERVTDVEVNEHRATLKTRQGAHEADFLLGADGANSLVRRRLLAPFSRAQFSIATGFYLRGTSSPEVAVHSVGDPAGYIWSFPRPDHVAIGICAQADSTSAARLQQVVREWTGRFWRPGGGCRLEPYSWPIPSLTHTDFAAQRPAGQRWMLLGDAAGLVDPLTREGIFFALRSADYAAAALAGQGDPPSSYLERLRRDIYPELARAAALKARFFTSRFTDLMVEALQRSPKVRAIMTDLVAGRQPYATLKGRLLRTFEVGLAWRLLMLQVGGMVGQGRAPGNERYRP